MLAGRTRKRGPSTSTRGGAGPSPCSTASVVSCAMARILLGVRVCVRTLFYPQAWLFEPFSCSYIGPPERPRGRPSPPLLDDVKRTGHGIVSLNGKKWLPLDRLNPDQQGNGSATLSTGTSLVAVRRAARLYDSRRRLPAMPRMRMGL